MKHIKVVLAFIGLCVLLLCTSCIKEEQFSNNTKGNFQALWRIIDEHYCFFDYKEKEYGLNWNEVYARYEPQATEGLSMRQQFELFTRMLAELKDGHVNLYSPFNVGRYWSWRENYPSHFSEALVEHYLGNDYQISSGLQYRILPDNVGYIRCASFASAKGDGNLDEVLLYLSTCNGLIIDVRNNGGGLISAAEQLASRFTNTPLLVGYMRYKTGKGHNDFSEFRPQWLKPSKGIRWQKPFVVLCNRGVYSAANDFIKYIKCCSNGIVIGDKSGGGAGMPFSSELPNGWSVRFSASPTFDNNKKDVEFGIEPHLYVSLLASDEIKGKDSLIEEAIKIITEKFGSYK